MFLMRGARLKKAKSRSWAGLSPPVSTSDRIGNTDGVICSTARSTSGGSFERTVPRRFQVNCSACTMLVPGLKSSDNSLAPRMVLERTWATPMTVLTASSSGTVTLACMFGTSSPGLRRRR